MDDLVFLDLGQTSLKCFASGIDLSQSDIKTSRESDNSGLNTMEREINAGRGRHDFAAGAARRMP